MALVAETYSFDAVSAPLLDMSRAQALGLTDSATGRG